LLANLARTILTYVGTCCCHDASSREANSIINKLCAVEAREAMAQHLYAMQDYIFISPFVRTCLACAMCVHMRSLLALRVCSRRTCVGTILFDRWECQKNPVAREGQPGGARRDHRGWENAGTHGEVVRKVLWRYIILRWISLPRAELQAHGFRDADRYIVIMKHEELEITIWN